MVQNNSTLQMLDFLFEFLLVVLAQYVCLFTENQFLWSLNKLFGLLCSCCMVYLTQQEIRP